MVDKAATYWHMLPEASQARKAIWDAINPHTGKRRVDEAFPDEIFEKRDHDMRVRCRVNGAIYQLCGSDNFDSLVGSPPYGIVFSEWALADPAAWAYMQPILEENGGWAVFITTPRGRNHAASFYDMAKDSPGWFCERLTVNETQVFDKDQLQRILRELVAQFGREEGMSKFEQEYFSSFDAALPGAYYGQEMNKADAEGRICNIPYKPGVPVFPVFDFGIGQSNATSIGFVQVVGKEPRMIDYHENNAGKIEDYGKFLKEKDYLYGKLILPHDGGDTRLATGLSYAEQFEAMGFECVVLPRTPDLLRDINITRQVLPEFWFDKRKCLRLVECLRAYHREWDEKNKVFKKTPKHNYASHGADMMRGTAIAYRQGLLETDVYAYNDPDDDYQSEDGRSGYSGY